MPRFSKRYNRSNRSKKSLRRPKKSLRRPKKSLRRIRKKKQSKRKQYGGMRLGPGYTPAMIQNFHQYEADFLEKQKQPTQTPRGYANSAKANLTSRVMRRIVKGSWLALALALAEPVPRPPPHAAPE